MSALQINTIRVGVIQAAPVYLDRDSTMDKTIGLIEKAAFEGVNLVLFPEVFFTGYPDWVWIVPNSQGNLLNQLYQKLWENAISVRDKYVRKLSELAAKHKIIVAMGIHEKNIEKSGSSLYNSLLLIDEEGKLRGVHRKLIPTGGERTVWSRGDGKSLKVYDTHIGKVGGLICWENYLPLARQSLYDQGIQIHLAPTWDKSDGWIQAMQFIAREGKMVVLSACQALKMCDIPDEYDFKSYYPDDREWINAGRSCIIDSKGNFLAEPVDKMEKIIIADIDLSENIRQKRMFDVAGHYSRPDIFHFTVNSDSRQKLS